MDLYIHHNLGRFPSFLEAACVLIFHHILVASILELHINGIIQYMRFLSGCFITAHYFRDSSVLLLCESVLFRLNCRVISHDREVP